jgi:hypothetical protein
MKIPAFQRKSGREISLRASVSGRIPQNKMTTNPTTPRTNKIRAAHGEEVEIPEFLVFINKPSPI